MVLISSPDFERIRRGSTDALVRRDLPAAAKQAADELAVQAELTAAALTATLGRPAALARAPLSSSRRAVGRSPTRGCRSSLRPKPR